MRISSAAAPLASLLVFASLAPRAAAQVVPLPTDADHRRLAINARDPGGGAHPVSVEQAEVSVVVNGFLAEQTVTLTLRNAADVLLEGDLTFPLPSGATVCGYALDVNGTLVDGVPVERQRARVSYEAEARRRVDPGFVEQAAGNQFRTRVYPITAHGTRTLRLQYTVDLAGSGDAMTCPLPLGWGERVGQLKLRVEVRGAAAAPVVGGAAGASLAFREAGGAYVAEQSYPNPAFDRDPVLSIVPQTAGSASIIVERRQRTVSYEDLLAGKPADGGAVEYFFAISDPTDAGGRAPARAKPARIGLLWDASLSRASADTARELGLLRRILQENVGAQVDVIVFRDAPEDAVVTRLTPASIEEVIGHLRSAPFDGATNLSALAAPRRAPAETKDAAAVPYDYWLLFSDGLATLGGELPATLDAPVYAINSAARADPGVLRRIAAKSGGASFDLTRSNDDAVVTAITHAPLALLAVDFDKAQVADVYPAPGQVVSGRLVLSGKLLAETATLRVKLGYGGQVTREAEYVIHRAGATGDGLVPRLWAQQKIADLSADAKANDAALGAVGREFNLVTPNTSLMVLETLDQYVRYRIVPPRSARRMFDAFVAQVGSMRDAAPPDSVTPREAGVASIERAWRERLAWWGTAFEHAAGYRWYDPDVAARLMELRIVATPNGRPNVRTPDVDLADRYTGHGSGGGMGGGAAGGGGGGLFGGSGAAGAAGVAKPAEGRAGEAPAIGNPRDRAAELDEDRKPDPAAPVVALRPWDPQAPYLARLRAAGPERAYDAYLAERAAYADNPAFFLDCGDELLRQDRRALGLRVLSNLAEMRLDQPALLRVLAQRLSHLGRADLAVGLYERLVALRPEEPQGYRDLALALADRADAAGGAAQAPDYSRALDLLNRVATTRWPRFDGIRVIALTDAAGLVARVGKLPGVRNPIDPRVVTPIELDLRIVLTWDTELADVDLLVREPSGEPCAYDHPQTTIGGLLSRDPAAGLGPIEYALRRAMPGAYKLSASYAAAPAQAQLAGPATVRALVVTHFGRADERRESLTVRLSSSRPVVELGTVTIAPAARPAQAE